MYQDIVLINARSIKEKRKRNLMLRKITLSNPAFICICESWLNDNFQNSEVCPKNYFIASRQDRDISKNGGGVCILARKGIQIKASGSIHISIDCQICYVELDSVKLILAYLAPNRKIEDDIACISYLSENLDGDCLLMGDLNLHEFKVDHYINGTMPSNNIITRKNTITVYDQLDFKQLFRFYVEPPEDVSDEDT